MILSKLQKEIINAPYDKMVICSSAASGKTTLMTEKVRKLLRDGVDPQTIAVITFTNMAAGTLRERLGADYKDGLFVGTIHSLANSMLVKNGINTRQLLDEENFDQLFELIDAHPECVIPYKWILLDEAQDSDRLQFKFLFEYIAPECFFVVGDPRQSIYQFKNSSPAYMMKLSKLPGVKLMSLNENYRNGANILNFAKRLIFPTGLNDDSLPMRDISGKVQEIPGTIPYLQKYFPTDTDEYNKYAILCRTNQEVFDAECILKKMNIPCDSFKQGDLTNEELDKKMKENTVKVLTIHSSKGLEWDNVFVFGARLYSDEERNVCYVAATRARNKLYWFVKPSYGRSKKGWF